MCYEYNKWEAVEREDAEQQRQADGRGVIAAEPEVQPTNIPGHNQDSKREQEPAILLERERLLSSLR